MDPITLHELNILDSNSNRLPQNIVYELMIHSIKGKHLCEEERKKFVINRSMPVEKIYNPVYVEPYAKDFINCYSEMVAMTNKECQNEYKNIFECLIVNHGGSKSFPIKCVKDMEIFIQCGIMK